MNLEYKDFNDKFNDGIKISIITLILNILLTIFKIFAGIKGKSHAMLADGIHTLSDVLTTFIVIFGLVIASKGPDKDHPYGHGKFELIFSKILSLIILATGLFIGIKGVQSLNSNTINTPNRLAVIAAILSVLTKEIMYRVTLKIAKETNSLSLEASAWHHRSDVYSSLGTFAGIIGSRLGFPILDPIGAIIVGFIIIKIGIELYLKSINGLVDEAAPSEKVHKLKRIILTTDGVEEISDLKTRNSGNGIFVDLSIRVNGDKNVTEGHDIAENVSLLIKSNLNNIKDCMVHVEPTID